MRRLELREPRRRNSLPVPQCRGLFVIRSLPDRGDFKVSTVVCHGQISHLTTPFPCHRINVARYLRVHGARYRGTTANRNRNATSAGCITPLRIPRDRVNTNSGLVLQAVQTYGVDEKFQKRSFEKERTFASRPAKRRQPCVLDGERKVETLHFGRKFSIFIKG